MNAPNFDQLAELYHGLATLLVRGGLTYPVAIQPPNEGTGLNRIVVEPVPAPIDPRLRAEGESHLRAVQKAARHLHDGPVLALGRIGSGTVVLRRSSYYAMIATCDALRAEYLGTAAKASKALPAQDLTLRRLAHAAAGVDPLRQGSGRAAAVGLTLVVTVPDRGKRALVLGHRRTDLATDPGLWHVVVSGMLQPSRGMPMWTTAQRELREELGVVLSHRELRRRARPLGLTYDLLRLKPDLCVRLDLERDDLPASGPHPTSEEYTARRLVKLVPDALARFWREHPPTLLTPAAAGAVALTERTAPL